MIINDEGLGKQLGEIVEALNKVEEVNKKLTSDYTGTDEFEVGCRVTYHGSLQEYHPYEFTITKLFNFNGVPCAALQGPYLDCWIERCRVTSIKHIEEGK